MDKISYLNSEYSFTALQKLYFPIKRILDISLSLIGLVVLFIFIVIIKIIYIFIGDHGDLFYVQERIGLNGEPFRMYKFRTMTPDADNELEEILKDPKHKEEWNRNHKLQDDPRITKLGHFLRTTSIDEVPQFINVLIGNMSLVGPRPLVKGELEVHNGTEKYNLVKPGITGWWACNGRSNISYDERLQLEYYYVDNFSMLLDFWTLLRTVVCVIKKTGAQ